MSKTFKWSILLIIITLGCLLLLQTEVKAAEIDSAETLKEAFNGKNATISGTTITLNGDVEFETSYEEEGVEKTTYDMLMLSGDNYVLNLNGHKLTLLELYVIDGSLTINDSTQKGKIDTRCVGVEQEGTLTVNQCIFATDAKDEFDGNVYEVDTDIFNYGNITFKNGSLEHIIWNEEGSTLIIENGTIPNISQLGTATIKNGKFKTLNTDISLAKTTIMGGEFSGDLEEVAVILQGEEQIDRNTIKSLLPDGYEANFETFNLDIYEPEDGPKYYTGIYGPKVKIVKATENYSEVFKKITTDGVWPVAAFKPANFEDSEFLLSAVANDILKSTGYEAIAYAYGSEFDPEVALVHVYNEKQSEEHVVKVKYIEPTKEKVKTVNSTLNKMKYYKTIDDMDVDTAYILDDLYLINYLFANAGTKRVSGDQALNFAKDLINATNGANISFKFDARAGGGNPDALYTFAMGQAIVYYDGEAFTSKNAALTASHVLYIPDDTADTDDAFIAAALKRIKDYIGKDAKISITVGGTLESLSNEDETFNQYKLFNEKTTGKNYYTVKINGKSYNFAICKKDVSKLETPKYVASDIISNIAVNSDSTEIPLDAAITVKKVENDTIKNSLGTTVYGAYDIKLYSNAKQESITKLENGKFVVSIPVPEILKDKEITVYYINSNGEKEEHIATVKEDIAYFETDHFSTYVLAEKIKETPKQEEKNDEILKPEDKGEKDETPKTGTENGEKTNIINLTVKTIMVAICISIGKKKIAKRKSL